MAHKLRLTLDLAEERFESAPHLPENAATLLNVALRYWTDDMISDETFAGYVRQAKDWIAEAKMPSPGVPVHGGTARRRGYPIRDCPYDTRTAAGQKWRREWNVAV